MSQRGWGIWSPLRNTGSVSGGITEILHGWARNVDSLLEKSAENMEAIACLASPLSSGARASAIFGGNMEKKDCTQNGGGRGFTQILPPKDREQEDDVRGCRGFGATEEDAGGNHGAAGAAKPKSFRAAGSNLLDHQLQQDG
ncbi:hypothetical protein QYE76_046494 [Lolium multiflorum]|uniref:Uncharacterized protein n=1 Tax=Lolium multiflorum TaxID=4521 RepID=A0AAD8TQ25_LOLMU|nr:hypothetical protein QYE76_046494 [Lolium multiflorum]